MAIESKTTNHLVKDEKIGHLTVLSRYRKGKKYFYHCQCDCGSFTEVEASQLEHKKQTTCLCKGQYLEIGKTYDRLTVKKRIRRGIYECDCACGKKNVRVNTSDVLTGRIRSCGCANQPYNRKVRKDSSTGIKGVTRHRTTGKYSAFICSNGKNRYLGSFTDIKDAKQAREEAENELRVQRGEFNE